MSNRVLQSILQGLSVPDFVYQTTDGTTYFTRAVNKFGGTPYGHDPLTNLMPYDLTYEVPSGVDLQEMARGVYAGSFKDTTEYTYLNREPLHQPESREPLQGLGRVPSFFGAHSQASTSSHRVSSFQGSNTSQTLPYLSSPKGSDRRNPGSQGRSSSYEGSSGSQTLSNLRDDRNDLVPEPVRAGSNHHADPPRVASSPAGFISVSSVIRARIHEITKKNPNFTSRDLVHAMDEHYRLELRAETGHRFGNVEDSVIAAYIDACKSLSPWDLCESLTIGQDTRARLARRFIHTSFLGLHQKVLRVCLPLDHASISDLTNDILRILHVYPATADQGVPSDPYRASHIEMAESRREVLRELVRRGFTERVPHIVQLRGLRSHPDMSIAAAEIFPDPTSSSKPPTRPRASVLQFSKGAKSDEAGGSRDTACRCNVESHQKLRPGSKSSPKETSGETSKKKQGKAPVDKDHKTDSFDYLSAAASSGVTPTEDEDSVSAHRLPHSTGIARAAEIFSRTDPWGNPEKTESKAYNIYGPASYMDSPKSTWHADPHGNAEKTDSEVEISPAKYTMGLSDQKSDY